MLDKMKSSSGCHNRDFGPKSERKGEFVRVTKSFLNSNASLARVELVGLQAEYEQSTTLMAVIMESMALQIV